MKLKKSLKKLSLIKETVAHLSEEQMKNANGGEISIIPTIRSRDYNCTVTVNVYDDTSISC